MLDSLPPHLRPNFFLASSLYTKASSLTPLIPNRRFAITSDIDLDFSHILFIIPILLEAAIFLSQTWVISLWGSLCGPSCLQSYSEMIVFPFALNSPWLRLNSILGIQALGSGFLNSTPAPPLLTLFRDYSGDFCAISLNFL